MVGGSLRLTIEIPRCDNFALRQQGGATHEVEHFTVVILQRLDLCTYPLSDILGHPIEAGSRI